MIRVTVWRNDADRARRAHNHMSPVRVESAVRYSPVQRLRLHHAEDPSPEKKLMHLIREAFASWIHQSYTYAITEQMGKLSGE